jgi:hypothetical protein
MLSVVIDKCLRQRVSLDTFHHKRYAQSDNYLRSPRQVVPPNRTRDRQFAATNLLPDVVIRFLNQLFTALLSKLVVISSSRVAA